MILFRYPWLWHFLALSPPPPARLSISLIINKTKSYNGKQRVTMAYKSLWGTSSSNGSLFTYPHRSIGVSQMFQAVPCWFPSLFPVLEMLFLQIIEWIASTLLSGQFSKHILVRLSFTNSFIIQTFTLFDFFLYFILLHSTHCKHTIYFLLYSLYCMN